jgi:hypothetical protein
MCCTLRRVCLLALHDASTRRFDQVESTSRAAGFNLTKKQALTNGRRTMRGDIPRCDACRALSVDAYVLKAEGGSHDRSEELSPSGSDSSDVGRPGTYIPTAVEAGKLLQEAQSAARVTADQLKRRTKDAGTSAHRTYSIRAGEAPTVVVVDDDPSVLRALSRLIRTRASGFWLSTGQAR